MLTIRLMQKFQNEVLIAYRCYLLLKPRFFRKTKISMYKTLKRPVLVFTDRNAELSQKSKGMNTPL